MEKHDLHHEFPQHYNRIHELKLTNNHFKSLFEKYEDLNHHIHGVESTEIFADSDLTNMKKQRLHLKDELLKIINE